MSARDDADRIAIGIVRTSHGVKGYFKVKSLSGETGHFVRLKTVSLRRGDLFVPYEVQEVRASASDVLMKLVGVDSPEDAKKFRGAEIWVDRKNAAPLGDGEYYLADISTCAVYHGEQEIGHVVSVFEGGRGDLMEVEDSSGRRVVLPFRDPFVGEVDIELKRIFVTEESFLDLFDSDPVP